MEAKYEVRMEQHPRYYRVVFTPDTNYGNITPHVVYNRKKAYELFAEIKALVNNTTPGRLVAYEYILNNHPDINIIQPAHHKSAVRNNENTYMIGIGFEGAYLRQSDYVVNLSADEEMYGYHGVRRLMAMLEKSIEEKADLKKMIDEYGAVV